MNKIKTTPLYTALTIVFVACLLISNITAVKLFSAGPFVLTAAVLLFPITYILNDVLAEVYGYTRARFAIIAGFSMNAIMAGFFSLTIVLPSPAYWSLQDSYASILGNTPRMLLASMCAYIVGTTLNARVMVSMRDRARAHNKGGLFMRCILSTLIGESCDSIIFVTIGFFGAMPLNAMFMMIITQAAFKTVYEIIVFPLTSIVIDKVKRMEE